MIMWTLSRNWPLQRSGRHQACDRNKTPHQEGKGRVQKTQVWISVHTQWKPIWGAEGLWRQSVKLRLEAWKKPPMTEPGTTGLGKEGGGTGLLLSDTVFHELFTEFSRPRVLVTQEKENEKTKQNKKRMLEEALPLWAWARHMQKAMLMLIIRQELMFRDTQNAKQLKTVVFALFLTKCSFPSLSWRDLTGVAEMAQRLTVHTCSYGGQVFESQHPSQEVQDHQRTPALTCRHTHRYTDTHTLK